MTSLVLWIALATAWADPEDALDPATRTIYRDAKKHEALGDTADADVARGEWDGAEARYRAVWRNDPTFTQAVVDLGRVLEKEGRTADAIDAYREAPYDADAVEALGRLYLKDHQYGRAAEVFETLETLRSEWPGAVLLEATAMAGVDPGKAEEMLRRYAGYANVTWDDDLRAAALGIYSGYREESKGDEADAFVRWVRDTWPDAGTDEALSGILDRADIEDEARRAATAAAEPLTPDQETRLSRAREAFAAGDVKGARTELEALTKEAPRSPDAWAALSDVLLSDVDASPEDVAEAEDAISRAAVLDPLDERYPARLGDLLATWYAGRFDADAADAYRRALRLHPDDADLWARLARVADWKPACDAWRRVLALRPEDDEAKRKNADCARVRPPDPRIAAAERPADIPEEAWRAFWMARVYQKRERPADALAAVEEALRVEPDYPEALDLEADLVLDGENVGPDDRKRAIELYQRSLAVDPRQEDVLERLGELELQSGDADAAERLWRDAASAGSADARYFLARTAESEGRPWEARRWLDAYFTSATSGANHERAVALREQVDRQIRTLWAAVGLTGFVAVAAPLAVWRRRRQGVGLEALLAAHPEVYRDVARRISAIRHEVLKHNTTLLPIVADALDAGDPEPAQWAAEKLFGDRGALARFSEHVAALEHVGAVHGVRLNLRHRDPTFGPLIAAVERLSRWEKDLRRGGGRRPEELRDLAKSLNQDGYRGLGRLLRRVCLLRMDASTVDRAWDAVRSEPDFRGKDVPELSVDVPEDVFFVRIFPSDLDDILVNVLRNALQATIEAGGGGRLAVRVESEEDEITGLERVAVRVLDDAPKRISTAVIRSRYIDRGLGLVVDLISKNGGSIAVEDEPGFAKAVVVRLPRAESPELEEP